MRLQPRKPVNSQSILSRKKKAFRRTKTILRDPETLEVIQPTAASKFLSKLAKPFKGEFWDDMWEQNDDETLVDT